MKIGLGRGSQSAGRTDRGVSAISQISSFISKDPITPNQIYDTFLKNIANVTREGAAGSVPLDEALVCYECRRVPRRFNARGSATWRRYLYILPLNDTEDRGLDVPSMNRMLSRLEGRELSFHAFSRGEVFRDRTGVNSSQDRCTILLARCSVISLDDNFHGLIFEVVGNRFLRNMVRVLTATVLRAAKEGVTDESHLVRLCEGGDRGSTAQPLPGAGLCLAGVGFDLHQLRRYQNMPKSRERELLLASQQLPIE